MATLALDTALDHCQAAIVAADGTIVAERVSLSQGNAEAIVGHVANMIAATGWDDIDRIAVTAGPGSFTGVRVGLAYAQGVALPRQLPVVGVGTLDVLASCTSGPTLAATDARHGAVFAGLFRMGSAPPPARRSVAEAAALAARYGARSVTYGAAPLLPGAITVERLNLSALAAIAAAQNPADAPPKAIYLANPDAAPQRHKALRRA